MIHNTPLPVHDLQKVPENTLIEDLLLEKEIKGVEFRFISMKGEVRFAGERGWNYYDVLLSLKTGDAILKINGNEYSVGPEHIVRIPYGKGYTMLVGEKRKFRFLLVRKYLDKKDKCIIKEKPEYHDAMYIKSFSECPVYTEDIKSEKTINRMLLPEGLVPRFCMGLVETEGPDEVGEHEHDMLDQVFLGLEDCRCLVHADGAKALLTQNMLLHIPLGSKHSVTVEEGNKLSYIWMDFFLSQEGQKYMEEQHHIKNE